MIKDKQGKFKKYYVTSTNNDGELYLTRNNKWSKNFNDAYLFSNKDEISKSLKDVLVIGYQIIIRSVICEINGYDLGTLLP